MTNNQESPDGLERAAFSQGFDARRVRMVCWGVALVLGAIQAWGTRHVVTSDGVCYLDMGDAFWRHGWGAMVNGYWSPFYPFLLGLGSRILRPSAFWELPVAHLVNFALYVAALASFDFFWNTLLSSNRVEAQKSSREGSTTLPEWAWLPLGFALFVWTTLQLIELSGLNPDIGVVVFVYLAAGLVLRIRMNPAGWRDFLTLGLVLGFGYLMKAALFPMAFVFLGTSALAVRNLRIALPRVAVGLVVFLLISSPLILSLSRAKGRLTFGDVGRVAYAIEVDGYPETNWQGTPAGSGTPKHPTRQILDEPPLFEFATPFTATFPPSYDASYWMEGVKPHFEIRRQASVLMTSLVEYYRIFATLQGGLIAGIVVLLLVGGRGRRAVQDIAEQWPLLIPALAAMGMYALVYVETRYVAPFVLLFWAAIFSGIHLPGDRESKRGAAAATIAILVTLGIQIACRTVMDMGKGMADAGKLECVVGAGLNRLGVEPGDKVAWAWSSSPDRVYWARAAKVSIVAEVRDNGTESFWWPADPQAKMQAFQAFAKTGAQAVVADKMPCPNWADDWQRIGTTSYYVHFLTRPTG